MQGSAQETSAKAASYQWWQCLPREAAKEGGREAENELGSVFWNEHSYSNFVNGQDVKNLGPS